MSVVLWLIFAVFFLNGIRVVIGIPPIYYWFHSRRCEECKGVGYIKEKKPSN